MLLKFKKLNFIQNFDKFGKEANLYYEGNEKRTSWIGFIFSIPFFKKYYYVILYLSFFYINL